jgi:hypothetical protein
MARAKKKDTPKETEEKLKAKRELFCRYYTQNSELFGNATLSYAEAFDYKLDELSREAIYEQVEDPETDEVTRGELIEDSEYDKAYHVCSVQSSKLLRNADIQARVTTLLNELSKDEVVDGELARVIRQNVKLDAKIAASREYNKLRGRIIDQSKHTLKVESFGVDDIRTILSVLPQERQDEVYAIVSTAIAEAELLRSSEEVPGTKPITLLKLISGMRFPKKLRLIFACLWLQQDLHGNPATRFIIKGRRGGGKSVMLGALGFAKWYLQLRNIVDMGGSMQQAEGVYTTTSPATSTRRSRLRTRCRPTPRCTTPRPTRATISRPWLLHRSRCAVRTRTIFS